MPHKYSTYLKNLHYNMCLDYCWYDDLKKKLDILEDHKIKINISELNRYLYDRYRYERYDIYTFDDTKYDLENFMQIVEYKKNSGYYADDEMQIKYNIMNSDFVKTMNILSDKLDKFCINY